MAKSIPQGQATGGKTKAVQSSVSKRTPGGSVGKVPSEYRGPQNGVKGK